MHSHGYYLFKLLRPRQWIKNLALFAAVTFSGQLFNPSTFWQVLMGFSAFCLLSSSTYIINDLLDVHKDRLHPFKRNRPIASGKVSINEAFVLLTVTLGAALILSFYLNWVFFLIAVVYLVLQMLYSLFFKSIAVFDILFIASGYILRILAGASIANFHISVWLLLTTISLSLFLATGKRRSELTLLQGVKKIKIDEIRKSLSHYSEPLLDSFSAIFATSTFIFYTMFTFLANPTGLQIQIDVLLPEFLPFEFLNRKWLMITIIPVIYGIMRYLQDIYERKEGESPDKVLMSDKSLLGAVISWAFLVIFIIYVLGG